MDPVGFRVPCQPGVVAEGDVVHVDERFLLALLVPHFVTGVAGIAEDRPDSTLGPGSTRPMRIALAVVGRGTQDLVGSQALRNGEDAYPREELAVDAPHDRRRLGVGFESAKPSSLGGLAGVRMRTGIGEEITVRWSSAEITSFDLCLGRHRRSDSDLDSTALTFRHAAEDRHDQVVRLGLRIDRTADFGHPQFDAVVGEHREGQSELVAVEGTLRFSDDDRVESSVRLLEQLEQLAGFGATFPRN